ncbi:hypothetical protein KHA80_21205 [Anaerobacillus sp. HL2]|nr:hypothetical protein KHA80_21205 [Anaerobacillus sp. HL2]
MEFDIHIIKDGHLVVIHDATVDRTTDGKGANIPSALQYAEIIRCRIPLYWTETELVYIEVNCFYSNKLLGFLKSSLKCL